MPYNLDILKSWQTWRVAQTEDTRITDFGPDSYLEGKTIDVSPWSLIAVRMFGKGADNDTVTIRILGWMDRNTKVGPGPAQLFFDNGVTLGGNAFNEAPIADGKWPATAGDWREVDDYLTTPVNACNAFVRLASAAQQTTLYLPTLGYAHLSLEVSDILGGGIEATALGAIYKPISTDWHWIS